MPYYVQKAMTDNNNEIFCGEYSKHSHEVETAFSRGVKNKMTQIHGGDGNVRLSPIQAEQSRVPQGAIELSFNNGQWN